MPAKPLTPEEAERFRSEDPLCVVEIDGVPYHADDLFACECCRKPSAFALESYLCEPCEEEDWEDVEAARQLASDYRSSAL